MPSARPVKIWDIGIRLFHWSLVILLPLLWLLGKQGEEIAEWAQERDIYFDYMVWHARLGYLVVGLLVFRVLWGFVGSTTARFAQFLKAPQTVLNYVRTLLPLKPTAAEITTPENTTSERIKAETSAPRTPTHEIVGHNPAGGWMVVLMLMLLIAQVITGLFSSDDVSFEAPFYASVDEAISSAMHSWHAINFNLILGAVVVHLNAIAFYTWIKREKLVPPMINGVRLIETDNMPNIIGGWRMLACLLSGAACTIWLWTY